MQRSSRILVVDASRGIRGDTALAAMMGLGLPASVLRECLRRVGPVGRTPEAHAILRRVRDSRLEEAVQSRVVRALEALVRAEAKAHRVRRSQVRFHQLARPDTLINLLGFSAGLEYFRVRQVYVSQILAGAAHRDSQGRMLRRPGPATAELLRPFPVDWVDGPEWTTPTGAALLAAFASPRPPPPFRLLGIGQGACPRSLPSRATVRLLLGETIGLTGIAKLV